MLWGVSGGWAWIAATCDGVTGWALAGVPKYDMFVLTRTVAPYHGEDDENWLMAINNTGLTMGANDNDPTRAFIYSTSGTITYISNPFIWDDGEDISNADIDDGGNIFFNPNRGTNGAGHSVGWFYDEEGTRDMVGYYRAGDYFAVIDLDPGINNDMETRCFDINDFDQIVGWFDYGEPELDTGFILTPCPFPWALGPGIYPPFIPLRPIVPGGSTGSGIGEGTPVVQKNGPGTVSGRAMPKRKSGIGK
jgi:hypothetical protein